MEAVLEEASLLKRAYWLINLRWFATAFLAAATFLAGIFWKIHLHDTALYSLAVCLVAYNFVLIVLLKTFAKSQKRDVSTSVQKIIVLQASADLVILTAVLHYCGGIENPFFFYFLFHVIIASVLFEKWLSYLEATLAVALFGLLILSECLGIIPHHGLQIFFPASLYKDGYYVAGIFFVFSTTVYLVSYMASSISDQLRKQQAGYRQVNALLQEKDHRQNEYVSRVTHDIKGHLSAVKSCLDLVTAKMVGPLNDKQLDLTQRASQRTTKCMAFVTALHKLSNLRLSDELEMKKFSLKKTVLDAIEAVENKAKDKAIHLTYNIEPEADDMYGNDVLIEETIANLLMNAVKYTFAGGSVKVDVAGHDDSVLVRISDTGIGIPTDEIGKLFAEFYRASNAKSVEKDGTGLGLSIAKEVVERHGGRIWAENQAGGGSIFSFTLLKSQRTEKMN
jgi:signal transduction histidine kinase